MNLLKNKDEDLPIIVSAPSGTGKSTVIQKIMSEDEGNRKYAFAVSTTSRHIRSGEEEGKNYYFVTPEEFKERVEKQDFLEWAIVHGNYYGTEKKEIDRIKKLKKIPIFDVDIQGARNLRKKMSHAVSIFIIPPSFDVLKARLMNRRTESEEQIRFRLENAVKELKEYKKYDYIIINDSLDETCLEFKAIIRAEMCRRNKDWINIDELFGR